MKILIYSDNVSANHVLYYSLGKLRGKQGIYYREGGGCRYTDGSHL